jgi:hypothetical protein
MSLNPSEQIVSDYVQSHPEEMRFWQEKVRTMTAQGIDPHASAVQLERELWRYFEERSHVAPPFRAVAAKGLTRVSLRNLAEYWLQLWAPPRTKPGGGKKNEFS